VQCLVGVMTKNLVVADAPSWVLCGVVQWLMPAWISMIVSAGPESSTGVRSRMSKTPSVGVRVVRPPRVPYGLWFWHSPQTLTFCRPKVPRIVAGTCRGLERPRGILGTWARSSAPML
jgi:hypothetical protein